MTEEYLLAALRLAAGSDPAPDLVIAAARAAYALRLPGGVVAHAVAVPRQTGTRCEQTTDVRRFATADLTIDLEPAVVTGHLEVAGHLSPPPQPGSWVQVRTPHVSVTRVPSESGQFVVTGLPPGWLSVVCHRPHRPPVSTRWIHLRP